MVANINNIQSILSDIPNRFVVNGVTIDNYSKSDTHFADGWRNVVVPEITEYQRLSDEWVLINDVVTKEVIDFTEEEILQSKINKAISIDLDYTNRISQLLRKHLEKLQFDEIPVPQYVKEQRDQLRQECNDKILALGITDFSYRKSVKGL